MNDQLEASVCRQVCGSDITLKEGQAVFLAEPDADGDTITVLDNKRQQHRIRLAGIDAPEKGQPFGQRSKQHLAKLALGKEAKADCYKVDRYGRDVCNVYVNGKDLGLAQLDAGLAWWYRKYAHEQAPRDRVDYDAAEGRAGARIGPGYGRTRTRCRRGSGVTSIVKLRGRFSAMQRRGAYRGVGSLDS